MQQPTKHSLPKKEHGFVLITSLLFLVIITLLALAGITSSTLQQKMTNNAAEKARALQAANSTLRYVESFVRGFNQNPLTNEFGYKINADGTVGRVKDASDFQVPRKKTRTAPGVWLQDSAWGTSGTYAAKVFTLSNGSTTKFRLTYERKISCTGLSATRAAKSSNGTYYYRITARSTGPDGRTPVVTQSVYRRRGTCA